MAELTPGFAAQLVREIENYEWHPGRASGREELHTVPMESADQIKKLASTFGLDTSVILQEALRIGLAELSSGASPNLKALVKRQGGLARGVYERLNPAERQRKRPRSKTA